MINKINNSHQVCINYMSVSGYWKRKTGHSSTITHANIFIRQELNNITDDAVVNDLRAADRRKNFWLEEDPSLERMLQWIRRQR